MNHLPAVFKPFLVLGLALTLTPVAGLWLATQTPCQATRAVAKAVSTELRETFNPGKLVRWGQSALALPAQVGNLFKPEEPTVNAEALGAFNMRLSWQIRRYHDLYFDQVSAGEHTVVAYEIGADGHVYNARIVPEYTSAPLDTAQLAVETVRNLDNRLPSLPADVRSVSVMELFWHGGRLDSEGSMVDYLSTLPDGRLIQPRTGSL
ncbi:MAG: hypothetical protein KME03_02235 [Aphanocapsa lilacina HA4352-LM1]|jgi:hypothetical protein|nr:hypothetical protein [Aphanocapsa lilacina HA4352-LM1]